MDHVSLAQLDTVESRTRRLGFDAGGHDRAHRAILDDQLDDHANVTDQLGGQDIDAGLDQLLTNREGVWPRAQR